MGDLKNAGSLLRELSEGFKGVVRMKIVRGGPVYDAEFILQNNFIIAASLKGPSEGMRVFGEKAFQAILRYVKESSGDVVAYELSDEEFKRYVSGNDAALLELVRDLGKTLEDMGRFDVDIRKDGLLDLEAQWKELESKWKQFEEKEKPYLEMILREDFRDRSYSKGGAGEPLLKEPSEDRFREEDDTLEHEGVPEATSPGAQKAEKEAMPSSEGAMPPVTAENPKSESSDSEGTYITPSSSGENAAEEKNLDEMILREDPWERIPGALSGSVSAEEVSEKEETAPRNRESEETVELRRELRGDFHGGDTEEEKAANASSERTLSDDFNERVRDAIMGRKHRPVSNAVVAHEAGSEPAVKPGGSSDAQTPKAAPDEWLTRANETLQRLKKKRGISATEPSNILDQSAERTQETEHAEEEIPLKTAVAPGETASGEPVADFGVSTAEETGDKTSEELINKTTSEISDLNKNVDVYWGWDKRKKRFVGIEGVEPHETTGNEPGENNATTQAPDSKAPATSCTVLREELKKQTQQVAQAQSVPREIIIKKEELIQAAQPQPEQPPKAEIPELKKKIGFIDKLKYAKYPQIVKVMEKVDGKKTIDELSNETALTPAAVKYIIEKLSSDGYLKIKEGA